MFTLLETPDSLKRTLILLPYFITRWTASGQEVCCRSFSKNSLKRQAISLRISLFVVGHFQRIAHTQKLLHLSTYIKFKKCVPGVSNWLDLL